MDEALARLCSPGEDLAARFAAKAQAAGMSVRRTRPDELADCLAEVLEQVGARTVVMCCGDPPLAGAIGDGAVRGGASVLDWRSGFDPGALFDAGAAITDVRAAVAETGSIVLGPDAAHARGAHVVPPVHVAIVHASRIVADLIDWARAFSASAQADESSATVLVTGPSKTADIEGMLVTGVHGPREVHVVLIEDR